MSFFRRLFELGSNSGVERSKMLIPKSHKYANWTKEQLIEKILEIEAADLNDKKRALYQPEENTKKSRKQKTSKEFDFSKYDVRFIALKFAYLGWNYNGLAVQKELTPLPTVEGTIIEALNKCKLVPSTNPQDYKFSRCGRTDKGVSAMNQVISLNVRSNLTVDEQNDPTNDIKEIQYVHVLNKLLPDDIRISAVCLRPPKRFDARFSCQYRHYRYLFLKEGLDINKMGQAATFYTGDNDFRNFCKLDGSKQISNYNRKIISSKILKISDDFYCFDLVGTAFLWHQVRCMMAVLFLIGQGLEEPQLVNDMLNIKLTPRKPVYEMANDIPLILYDCSFHDMEWTTTNFTDYRSITHGNDLSALTSHYQMKAEVAKIFKNVLTSELDSNVELVGKTRINLGDGKGKVINKYEKISNRNVMETPEEVNEKFKRRKKAKSASKN